MSSQNNHGSPDPNTTTGSFASRLLSRALADRKKTTTEIDRPTVADAAKYSNQTDEVVKELTATRP